MIRITKPVNAPKSLTIKGALQKGKDCAAYDGCPRDYRSGKKKLEAKRSIYASKQVKKVLGKAHHNKCCYCEKRFSEPINLAVEHFRPKSGVRQSKKQKEESPGYYWLAYEWENLLLSCHTCNSTYKQTVFPLANPKVRARSHHQDIRVERPLVVNPATEDPRDHVRFRGDDLEPITTIGRKTIHVVGLRRPSLREDRLKHLQRLKMYWRITSLAAGRPQDHELQREVNELRNNLMSSIRPEEEFSSMAQDYLKSVHLI